MDELGLHRGERQAVALQRLDDAGLERSLIGVAQERRERPQPVVRGSSSHRPGAGGANVTADAVVLVDGVVDGAEWMVLSVIGAPFGSSMTQSWQWTVVKTYCCHHVGNLPRWLARHDEHVTRTFRARYIHSDVAVSAKSPRRGT